MNFGIVLCIVFIAILIAVGNRSVSCAQSIKSDAKTQYRDIREFKPPPDGFAYGFGKRGIRKRDKYIKIIMSLLTKNHPYRCVLLYIFLYYFFICISFNKLRYNVEYICKLSVGK